MGWSTDIILNLVRLLAIQSNASNLPSATPVTYVPFTDWFSLMHHSSKLSYFHVLKYQVIFFSTRLNTPHEEVFHFGTFYGIPCSRRSDAQIFLLLIRKLPLQSAHSLCECVAVIAQ